MSNLAPQEGCKGGWKGTYYWSKDEEKKLVEVWKATEDVNKCVEVLGIPYEKVNSKLTNLMLRDKRIDVRRLQAMSKSYTLSEIAAKLGMSESAVEKCASRNSIALARNGAKFRAERMPYPMKYRVYSVLANAILQADAERMAIVEVRYHSKNARLYGKRCTAAEFIVYGERHPRLENIELGRNDVYIKTPDRGEYLISSDEILKLSNVYKGHTTIINSQYDEREW